MFAALLLLPHAASAAEVVVQAFQFTDSVLQASSAVAFGDLNDDGFEDVIVSDRGTGSVAYYLVNSTSAPQEVVLTTAVLEASDVIVHDLDGDGDLDVAAASAGTGAVTWWANLGGDLGFDLVGKPAGATSAELTSIWPVDADQSGIVDVVMAADGDLAWASHTSTAPDAWSGPWTWFSNVVTPGYVGMGDINGDELPDLVVPEASEDRITWYSLTGDGTLVEQTSLEAGADPHMARVGDVTGDGWNDVVVTAFSANEVLLFVNDGLGALEELPDVLSADAQIGPRGLCLVDLDLDGDLDVVVASESDGVVGWYENEDGEGTFADLVVLASAVGSGPLAVAAGDGDGDGDQDLAVVSDFGELYTLQVFTVPFKPADLSTTASADGSWQLSWTAPGDNGDTITEYTVADGEGNTLGTTADTFFSSTEALADGATTVKVRAHNARGAGPWSDAKDWVCYDGFVSGDETGTDCGGSLCDARCGLWESCLLDSDCESGYCSLVDSSVCIRAVTFSLDEDLEVGSTANVTISVEQWPPDSDLSVTVTSQAPEYVTVSPGSVVLGPDALTASVMLSADGAVQTSLQVELGGTDASTYGTPSLTVSPACPVPWDGILCDGCLALFYLTDEGSCDSCPDFATCAGGDDPPQPEEGYFSDVAGVVEECIPAEACPGGFGDACNAGYTGTRCAQCIEGQFYRVSSLCAECPSNIAGRVVPAVLLLAVLLGVAYKFYERRRLLVEAVAPAASIAVDFLQISSMLAAYDFWPSSVGGTLNAFSLANFNFELLGVECAGASFEARWFIVMAVPPLVAALPLLARAAFTLRHRHLDAPPRWTRANQMAAESLRLTLLQVIFLFVTVSIMNVFDCVPQESGGSVLEQMPSQYCIAPWGEDTPADGDQSTHRLLVGPALLALAAYTLGIPAYFYWLMTRPQTAATRALFERFRPETRWWVLIILLRKLCFSFASIMFSYSVIFQLTSMVLVIVLAWVAHTAFQPYRDDSTLRGFNALEGVALFCEFMVLLAGLLFASADFDSTWKTGFLEFTTMLILLGCCLVIAYYVAQYAKQAYETARRESTADVGKKQQDNVGDLGDVEMAPVEAWTTVKPPAVRNSETDFGLLRGALAERERSIVELEGSLESARDALAATRGELDSARSELDSTRDELERVRGECEAAQQELESTRGELQEARAKVQELEEAAAAKADASSDVASDAGSDAGGSDDGAGGSDAGGSDSGSDRAPLHVDTAVSRLSEEEQGVFPPDSPPIRVEHVIPSDGIGSPAINVERVQASDGIGSASSSDDEQPDLEPAEGSSDDDA